MRQVPDLILLMSEIEATCSLPYFIPNSLQPGRVAACPYSWSVTVDASYFRALATRCYRLSGCVFELKAIEEFRKLGDEFLAKANQAQLQSGVIWTEPKAPRSDDEHT
jgi:hypothetical protein